MVGGRGSDGTAAHRGHGGGGIEGHWVHPHGGGWSLGRLQDEGGPTLPWFGRGSAPHSP